MMVRTPGRARESAAVVRLPAAAESYMRVMRRGRRWCVELVTPCDGARPIVTSLGGTPSQTAAVAYAEQLGARMRRPVRLPRRSASCPDRGGEL